MFPPRQGMQKTKYASSINARKRADGWARSRQSVTNPITSIRSSTHSSHAWANIERGRRGVHVEKAELAFHFKQVDSDLLVTSHPNGAYI